MNVFPRTSIVDTPLYKKTDAPVLPAFDSVLCVGDEFVGAYHVCEKVGVLVVLYLKSMTIPTEILIGNLSDLSALYVYTPSKMYLPLDGFEYMRAKTTQTVLKQPLEVEMSEWKYIF
jgi:hypothetical protein